MKKRITPARRRHQDYLRRKAMATAKVYDTRLRRYRIENLRNILKICRDYQPDQWEQVFSGISEPYLFGWYEGLWLATGVPQVGSTLRDMNRAKAEDSGIWQQTLLNYARKRAGSEVASVSGTFRDSLIRILRAELEDDGASIETLTRRISRQYNTIQEWEVRRIVQTETMISLAEAGNAAATSLEVPFTKTWCTSGLANTRDTHLAVDGVTVDEYESFQVGESLMLYPHDVSLGAAASEIINCACSVIREPK